MNIFRFRIKIVFFKYSKIIFKNSKPVKVNILRNKNSTVMNNIKLNGPFELCEKEINSVIPAGIIGNYLLGYCQTPDDLFNVLYVGHANDLNSKLKEHLGNFSEFKYASVDSLLQAYMNDCMLYHMFTEESFIINERHPIAPFDSKWTCPFCGKNGQH